MNEHTQRVTDFLAFLRKQNALNDPSHDELHIRRVVANAMKLGQEEGADRTVLFAAAWLHDCVYVEKNDPRRAAAAQLSAEAARAFLAPKGWYSDEALEAIAHCIAAHSFSGPIQPQSLEARILRDADRLDALGAIGIARCFSVGARIGTQFYHPEDPLAKGREWDDSAYSVDHFYTKLLRLPETMFTEAGRIEAQKRSDFMQTFLAQLLAEIGH